MPVWFRRLLIAALLLIFSGCSFFPEISRQPQTHNPFPQLSRVAVAPFFNLTTDATVDGRQFALAYFNELQSVPGFEVVPVGVVELKMREFELPLTNPVEARKLAQLLDVDAVVVGAVTDFTPYYPPRCGLQVEWYSANPGYHPIPPGYGLPWGTIDEESIPGPLIFEAQMALARAQLKTQDPAYRPVPVTPPGAKRFEELPKPPGEQGSRRGVTTLTSAEADTSDPAPVIATPATGVSGLPLEWPDPSGFTPRPPSAERPPLRESIDPVLRHTRIYNGHDGDFTEALRTYAHFRDDARFGGWQSYLQRSEDFIRFCCHMHINEMLTARGGAGETRVVWRWPTGR